MPRLPHRGARRHHRVGLAPIQPVETRTDAQTLRSRKSPTPAQWGRNAQCHMRMQLVGPNQRHACTTPAYAAEDGPNHRGHWRATRARESLKRRRERLPI
eukprot:9165992-Pyramimonas_sp.AAC.1